MDEPIKEYLQWLETTSWLDTNKNSVKVPPTVIVKLIDVIKSMDQQLAVLNNVKHECPLLREK